MTEKLTHERRRIVRIENLDEAPAAPQLSRAFKELDDEEADQRAKGDVDAGEIPPGFWEAAAPVAADAKEQVTLRLDAEVLRHFRQTGKGYQSRINAVLKSYVRARSGT